MRSAAACARLPSGAARVAGMRPSLACEAGIIESGDLASEDSLGRGFGGCVSSAAGLWCPLG